MLVFLLDDVLREKTVYKRWNALIDRTIFTIMQVFEPLIILIKGATF